MSARTALHLPTRGRLGVVLALAWVCTWIGLLAQSGIGLDLYGFTGATMLADSGKQLSAAAVVPFGLWHAALTSAAVCLIAAIARRPGMFRPALAPTVAGVALAVGVGVGAGALLAAVERDPGLWIGRGTAAWQCQPVNSAGSVACIQRDLAHFSADYYWQMSNLDNALVSAVAGAKGAPTSFRYVLAQSAAATPTPPGQRVVDVFTDLNDPHSSWGQTAASSLAHGQPILPVPTGQLSAQECDTRLLSLRDNVVAATNGYRVSPSALRTDLAAIGCQ